MSVKETVSIDRDLKQRLAAIAEREGATVSELAENVLRLHAEEAEREEAVTAEDDFSEDDRRWAEYLETGESISFEEVRAKLRARADEAARKAVTK